MAKDFEFKIEGLDGVIDALSKLPDLLQKKGARKAARQGMNIVRDAARNRAHTIDDPETDTTIWRNIVTQESGKAGKREGGIVMRVGVQGGAGTPRGVRRPKVGRGGATQHWRHLEFGTVKTKAQPFMREAFSANVGAVTDTVVEVLKDEIDTLAKSLKKT